MEIYAKYQINLKISKLKGLKLYYNLERFCNFKFLTTDSEQHMWLLISDLEAISENLHRAEIQ
jgi:hypothetical protein